jgi:hypothetical protein
MATQRLIDTSTGATIERDFVDAREMQRVSPNRYRLEGDPNLPQRPPKPEGAALAADVMAAFNALDPDNDFNKTDGKPKPSALQRELGYFVTSDERDAAWTEYQDMKRQS